MHAYDVFSSNKCMFWALIDGFLTLYRIEELGKAPTRTTGQVHPMKPIDPISHPDCKGISVAFKIHELAFPATIKHTPNLLLGLGDQFGIAFRLKLRIAVVDAVVICLHAALCGDQFHSVARSVVQRVHECLGDAPDLDIVFEPEDVDAHPEVEVHRDLERRFIARGELEHKVEAEGAHGVGGEHALHADAYRCGNLNAGQHGQAKAPAEPGRGFKGLPEVVQIDVVPDQRYGDGHRQRQSCLDIKESDRIPHRPVTGADVDDADGEAQLRRFVGDALIARIAVRLGDDPALEHHEGGHVQGERAHRGPFILHGGHQGVHPGRLLGKNRRLLVHLRLLVQLHLVLGLPGMVGVPAFPLAALAALVVRRAGGEIRKAISNAHPPVQTEGEFRHVFIQKGNVDAEVGMVEERGQVVALKIEGEQRAHSADGVRHCGVHGVVLAVDGLVDHAALHRQHGIHPGAVADFEADLLAGLEYLLPLVAEGEASG